MYILLLKVQMNILTISLNFYFILLKGGIENHHPILFFCFNSSNTWGNLRFYVLSLMSTLLPTLPQDWPDYYQYDGNMVMDRDS